LLEEAFGWPMHSLAYCWPSNSTGYGVPNGGILSKKTFHSNSLGWRRPIVLPLRPIWSGFVINTALWALVLWPLVILAAMALGFVRGFRRWHRRRMGPCPQCAYDLKGKLEAGCPECAWNRESPAQ
jgi:hypothetical protein